jgi:ABC-2 type transport system permease protein
MVDGTRIWQFSALDLGLLVGVPAGYVLFGYVVFRYTTRRARRLGVLGDY